MYVPVALPYTVCVCVCERACAARAALCWAPLYILGSRHRISSTSNSVHTPHLKHIPICVCLCVCTCVLVRMRTCVGLTVCSNRVKRPTRRETRSLSSRERIRHIYSTETRFIMISSSGLQFHTLRELQRKGIREREKVGPVAVERGEVICLSLSLPVCNPWPMAMDGQREQTHRHTALGGIVTAFPS